MFLMSQDSQVVHTRRGARPGGLIADLLFSVVFVRALETRRLEGSMHNVPSFWWDGLRTFQPAPKPRSPGPELVVIAETAKSIGTVTSHSAGRVMDAFAESGFVANLGAS